MLENMKQIISVCILKTSDDVGGPVQEFNKQFITLVRAK